MELRRSNRRHQGDIGEAYAASWLVRAGYGVWVPFGHSPDCDLIAERDGSLHRIQVKTSTVFRNDRWEIAVCTRGGNRSWSGIAKRLDSNRFDYLFVVTGDWRCWLIPSTAVGGRMTLLLGGPRYARFEVDQPIESVGGL